MVGGERRSARCAMMQHASEAATRQHHHMIRAAASNVGLATNPIPALYYEDERLSVFVLTTTPICYE